MSTEESRNRQAFERAMRPVPDVAQYNKCPKCGTRWTPPELKCPTCQDADQPTATATPRTDEALIEKLSCTDGGDAECTVYPAEEIVDADFARTLERELSSAQAALAEAKADNESLRTLWTEIRTVLIQSRAANCVCSYGAQQADAVEAANAVLKRMPPDVTTERDQLRARVAELEKDKARLIQVGCELYVASFWESRTLSVGEQVHLWVKFREALGLPAGTATSQGKGAT